MRTEDQPVPGGGLRGADLDHRPARWQPIKLHLLAHSERQGGWIELVGARITEGPPHRPLAEGEQRPVEISTGRRQRVLHDLACTAVAPVHDADRLEVTEALHQHAPGNARKAPVQLVETPRPVEQVPHDQHAPPVPDRLDRDRQRTVLTEASHRSSVDAILPRRVQYIRGQALPTTDVGGVLAYYPCPGAVFAAMTNADFDPAMTEILTAVQPLVRELATETARRPRLTCRSRDRVGYFFFLPDLATSCSSNCSMRPSDAVSPWSTADEPPSATHSSL